jgi:hypothetical protein
MTQDFENDLKREFAALDEDLPAPQFTARLMSELHKPRRRERLLAASAVLAALVFLGFSFPYLRTGVGMFAESLSGVSPSPLLYVYGTALGGYLLAWLMRRFPVRLM